MADHVINCYWREKLLFEAVDKDNHTLIMDTGPDFGGDNKGFSPKQLLLVAVSGCMSMDVKMILDKKRMGVTRYRVEVIGTSDEDAMPKIYKRILLRFYVAGTNVDKENVEKAVTLSHEKYCSVGAMLGKSAWLAYEVVIEDN